MADAHMHASDQIYSLVADGSEMTIGELEWFIHTVFIDTTTDQLAQITQGLSKTVTRAEFSTALWSLAHRRPTTTYVFNMWNKSNKQQLDAEDMHNVFKSIGISCKPEYIQAIMNAFPESGINLYTFSQMLTQESQTTE